jgi:hypothetical protein
MLSKGFSPLLDRMVQDAAVDVCRVYLTQGTFTVPTDKLLWKL